MFAALLSLATAAPGEEETSKTLFYVLGGLLAVWAIVLFAVGMRSSSFPGSSGAMRGVIAISAVLVAATMASAVITG
jgi:hypothetical protein